MTMTTSLWRNRLRALAGFGRCGLHRTWSLLWPFLLAIGLALGFVLVTAWGFGDLQNYRQWVGAHQAGFLVWRLCLYTGLVALWRKPRRRLLRAADDRGRIYRCELLAVLVIVLFELRNAGLL